MMSINLRIGMRMTRTNLRIMMVATVNEEDEEDDEDGFEDNDVCCH